MKIVFFGTPSFAIPSLDILYLNQCLCAVITKPDRPAGRGYRPRPPVVKIRAQELGIPVFQFEDLRKEEAVTLFQDLKPHLLVTVAFGQLLPRHVLNSAQIGAINLHPSLLPKYRGPSPISWAIIKGEQKTGTTIHWMSEGMDEGDIFIQEEVEITPHDTLGSLSKKLSEIGAKLLNKAVNMIERNEVRRIPQMSQNATFAPKIRRSDCLINWEMSPKEIDRLVRGLDPTPGAYTTLGGKVLKIWQVAPLDKSSFPSTGKYGLILDLKDRIVVECREGYLEILELQPEGRRRMNAGSFLCGHKIQGGRFQ
jgi:methionyl-tRNA formyltransferase